LPVLAHPEGMLFAYNSFITGKIFPRIVAQRPNRFRRVHQVANWIKEMLRNRGFEIRSLEIRDMTTSLRKNKCTGQDSKKAVTAGFTLIELMIVVAIVAIIMGVAVPAISQYRDHHQFSGAVIEVLSSLRRARMTAVELNRNVVFEVDVANGSYRAFVDDGAGIPENAGNASWDTGEQVIGATVLPRGVEFTSATFGGESFFTFSGRGFPMNGNAAVGGTIDLAGNLGTTRSVVLILSGHARIQ
jgi:type IV fimbrial biogenesis protein FimT